jgi:hypothetical protein
VLVLDDGEVIQGSREIAQWARSNPVAATTAAAGVAAGSGTGSAAEES